MGTLYLETKYLLFEDWTPKDRKTRILHVISVNQGNTLGAIRWYGAWRQYCFYPSANTIWNTECLSEIRGAIIGLMEERKNRAGSA